MIFPETVVAFDSVYVLEESRILGRKPRLSVQAFLDRVTAANNGLSYVFLLNRIVIAVAAEGPYWNFYDGNVARQLDLSDFPDKTIAIYRRLL